VAKKLLQERSVLNNKYEIILIEIWIPGVREEVPGLEIAGVKAQKWIA
jgi:hypothetical protein